MPHRYKLTHAIFAFCDQPQPSAIITRNTTHAYYASAATTTTATTVAAYADRNDIVACFCKCRTNTSQVHSSMKYFCVLHLHRNAVVIVIDDVIMRCTNMRAHTHICVYVRRRSVFIFLAFRRSFPFVSRSGKICLWYTPPPNIFVIIAIIAISELVAWKKGVKFLKFFFNMWVFLLHFYWIFFMNFSPISIRAAWASYSIRIAIT